MHRKLLPLLIGLAASCLGQPGDLYVKEIGDLKSDYTKLEAEVFDVEKVSPKPMPADREKEVEDAMQALIRRGVVRLLNSHNGSSDAVQGGIREMQSITDVAPDFTPDFTNVPFADAFRLYGEPGIVTANYGSSQYVPPFIDFYLRVDGIWTLRATTGAEFSDSTFFISRLPSPLAGQLWYLAWGHVIGDSSTSLKLRLYSFDGTSVRTVWKRDGLVGGSVSVSGSKVTLEHEKDYHQPNESRVSEILYVTPNGLE